jgi:hypothetical protein
MTYLGAGVLVAAVVVVAVVLLVRRSVTTGALGQYVAPYAEPSTEPSAGGVELVGGGVWTWGVRASPPLVRLYVGPDDVRIGPSSPGWSFLIPSLVVPRADLISVAEVERPFGRRGVRFSVPGASFAFIGEVDAVLGAVAAHPPPASSLG